ncbi:hypothetical protein RvY_12429-2 [Ramazzottius varieornatus]|uniref:Uncharacterized protein n=1 Tax=Ramazzottius varieornatus TaxID=947166 RepID=A0A1D1VLG9_RAMVA|nr:hypothetical protein RvY_12429-2 [Ramazzottius varieornatus]
MDVVSSASTQNTKVASRATINTTTDNWPNRSHTTMRLLHISTFDPFLLLIKVWTLYSIYDMPHTAPSNFSIQHPYKGTNMLHNHSNIIAKSERKKPQNIRAEYPTAK